MSVDKATNLLATIEMPGQVRAKKNSRTAVTTGGKTYTRPNKGHDAWLRDALQHIAIWRMTARPMPFPEELSIQVSLYRRDRTHYDPDNMGASVLDALVDSGIIPRDGYPTVLWVLSHHAGIDAQNPRAVVRIYDGGVGPRDDVVEVTEVGDRVRTFREAVPAAVSEQDIADRSG